MAIKGANIKKNGGQLLNLSGLHNLEYLVLRKFKLSSNQFKNGDTFGKLRKLVLVNCNLKSFDSATAFFYLPGLEILSIEHAHNCAQLVLDNLARLRWFRITASDSIQSDLFLKSLETSAPDLNVLELTHSQRKTYTVLPSLLQFKHASLKVLNLSNNFASQFFDARLFSNLPCLSHLFLDNNQIERVQLDYEFLAGLESIDLSSNQLSMLPESAFHRLANLRSLDLSNNSNLRIDTHSFVGLGNLENLYLANIASDSTSNIFSSPQIFTHLSNLKCLDLKRNRLVKLDWSTVFAPISRSLTRLDLSENALDLSAGDCFSSLGKLEFLDLSRNDLAALEHNALRGLDRLEVLNLAYNFLTRIDTIVEFAANNLKRLRKVCLRYNQIESVSQLGPELDTENRFQVDLRNNPVYYDCHSRTDDTRVQSKACIIA